MFVNTCCERGMLYVESKCLFSSLWNHDIGFGQCPNHRKIISK